MNKLDINILTARQQGSKPAGVRGIVSDYLYFGAGFVAFYHSSVIMFALQSSFSDSLYF